MPDSPTSSCSVIIVAAGASRRIGFDKLMAPLDKKPVLRWTIEAFACCPEVEEVILVTSPERFIAVTEPYKKLPFLVKRVDGGSERHFSVAAGLKALSSSCAWVAVHDGARPLISPQQFQRCLHTAQQTGAAASAKPVVDTLKRIDKQGFSGESVDRDNLWAMETPQIFSRTLINTAYHTVLEQGLLVTDEVSALEHIGHKTRLVANDSPNIKITHAGDLALIAKLLK